MRLRFKLMAALLATGLGSVVLVGGVAYVSVTYKVDSLRRQQAAEHFHTYMTAYLAEYGDWKNAIATESFDRFVRRQEGERTSGSELPSEMLERMPPRINDQARYAGPARDGRPALREAGAADGASAARPPRERPAPPPVPQEALPPDAQGLQEGPPPEGWRRPRDGYGPPREGERGPRDGYGPPPEGERPPRDGYGPPPEGERPPRDRYGPPPEGERPPRDRHGPPPEGERPPRDGYGPPPEGERRPHDGYGPPPEGPRGAPPRENARPAPPPVPALEARPRPQQAPAPDQVRSANEALRRPPGEPDGAGERPPPRRRGDGPPPFRFVLADADYKILLGGGQFRVDDSLPEALRATARPIVVKDQTVAYMSSEGALTPTPQEQKYIDALYNSLLWGIAAAAGLATLLGVLLSRGLSRSLSGLTQAVKGMHEGELRQQVPVKGKDEVAALASAFNEMSEQLAQSHEELNASHATILQQAEQLRELSIRDALTQLYNRRHFDEQANTLFNQAVRHKRPLALVICDIDHFKKINDTYSHATGDVVLRHVGNILRKHMRLSDLVARYGGEEFVMAFPETPGPQAAALCDKLRGLIESYPWHEVHPDLKVTMSMGVYADIAAGSAETMLQKADALLYRAKESGRNRVCFV
jgi:diguanylate cyclase (GGDEF)-like protein